MEPPDSAGLEGRIRNLLDVPGGTTKTSEDALAERLAKLRRGNACITSTPDALSRRLANLNEGTQFEEPAASATPEVLAARFAKLSDRKVLEVADAATRNDGEGDDDEDEEELEAMLAAALAESGSAEATGENGESERQYVERILPASFLRKLEGWEIVAKAEADGASTAAAAVASRRGLLARFNGDGRRAGSFAAKERPSLPGTAAADALESAVCVRTPPLPEGDFEHSDAPLAAEEEDLMAMVEDDVRLGVGGYAHTTTDDSSACGGVGDGGGGNGGGGDGGGDHDGELRSIMERAQDEVRLGVDGVGGGYVLPQAPISVPRLPKTKPGTAGGGGGIGEARDFPGGGGAAKSRTGSVQTTGSRAAAATAPETAESSDEGEDVWCNVCSEDAALWCPACGGDELYWCRRCWREMHVGDPDLEGHRQNAVGGGKGGGANMGRRHGCR